MDDKIWAALVGVGAIASGFLTKFAAKWLERWKTKKDRNDNKDDKIEQLLETRLVKVEKANAALESVVADQNKQIIELSQATAAQGVTIKSLLHLITVLDPENADKIMVLYEDN